MSCNGTLTTTPTNLLFTRAVFGDIPSVTNMVTNGNIWAPMATIGTSEVTNVNHWLRATPNDIW